MSKLVTIEQLKPKRAKRKSSTKYKTLKDKVIVKICSQKEPHVEITRDICLSLIVLTAYFIVPDSVVTEFDTGKYILVTQTKSVTEEYLTHTFTQDKHVVEYLRGQCTVLKQELLSRFAKHHFTSFYYDNVPNKFKVIDVEKLDKVSLI